MTLTLGTGPFGQTPAGVFNDAVDVDGRVIWWEDSPRRVRGILGQETVVDSRRVKLLHESGCCRAGTSRARTCAGTRSSQRIAARTAR